MERKTPGKSPLLRFHAATLVRRAFPPPAAPPMPGRVGRDRRLPIRVWAVGGIALILFAHWEMATAALQARFFSALASKLQYTVEPGRSPSIEFPRRRGPFDERRGYSMVPEFARRLETRGFRMAEQARFTSALAFAAKLGVPPPYREPALAGLVIEGEEGDSLYDATAGLQAFASYEEVPPVIAQALVFIENRELAGSRSPYSNPAIDWSRFAKGLLLYFGSRLGLPVPVEGGSTLAVQMEKYRHSPDGRTSSGIEKVRQMIAASLKVYREGPVTTEERQQIVLDYVNSVPLGAAPGYGEVSGLDEGLRVWFGVDPRRTYRTLTNPKSERQEARALKRVLALICAVRAPTRYLTADRDGLERRVERYARLMAERGIIRPELAEAVAKAPLRFASAAATRARAGADKATLLVRKRLVNLLAVRDFYALDRLHMNVSTTIDPGLERDVTRFFGKLGDTAYVAAHGLKAERLLGNADPRFVTYSLVLRERTPEGDVIRVHADNRRGPFDVIEGAKMELGSTAKLRTLVHYLQVMAELHAELSPLSEPLVAARARAARDPLTRWAADTLRQNPGLSLEGFLQGSMTRRYSATPWEVFYTGGGMHTFQNYDKDDNGRIYTLREGAVRSSNLVFVRLMRDLVRYHTARLPYDAHAILGPANSRARTAMLREVAREEGTAEEMAWLFRTRNRRAQDLRLRARIERDAFARMTPYWRRLGFPFGKLVPSYATAIGSSSDQPAALADLMGILMNDGVRRPPGLIRRISFASGTPYESTLEAPLPRGGEALIPPEVARVTRAVLADVVQRGTAQRVRAAFTDSTGAPVWLAGKTGTGDNRRESYGRGRRLIASKAVSRTAAFAFLLGDRYYGVITASVEGPRADRYAFTSALPLEALRLLAPTLQKRLDLVGMPRAMTADALVESGALDVPEDGVPSDSTLTPAADDSTVVAPAMDAPASVERDGSAARDGNDAERTLDQTKKDAGSPVPATRKGKPWRPKYPPPPIATR